MAKQKTQKEPVQRIITETHRSRAARLRSIYQRKKDELGLTQEKLRDLAGFKNQSIISQYMNAKVALNTDAIIRGSSSFSVDFLMKYLREFRLFLPHQK